MTVHSFPKLWYEIHYLSNGSKWIYITHTSSVASEVTVEQKHVNYRRRLVDGGAVDNIFMMW